MVADKTPLGTVGHMIYGGYVMDDETNSKISGPQRYVEYRNIAVNCSIVAASLRYFHNLVGKAGWVVDPADKSAEAQRAAELVQLSIDKLATPWARAVRHMAMFRFHGFSLQEWVAGESTSNPGDFVIRDLQNRPQSTIEQWHPGTQGSILGVTQRDPGQSQLYRIPMRRLIYTVDDVLSASPEGLGLFRQVTAPVNRLFRFEELESFGFEVDLRGMPVIKAPLAAMDRLVAAGKITPADKEQLLAPFKDFLRNHWSNPQLGMIVDSEPHRSSDDAESPTGPAQFDIKLLQGQSTAHQEVARSISRLTYDVARIMGTDNLLLGSANTGGSYALSSDKAQNFAAVIDATLGDVKEVLDRQFCPRVLTLNNIDLKYTPKLRVEQVRFRDVAEIGTTLANMARAGAVMAPDDPAVNDMRDLLGVAPLPPEIAARLVKQKEQELLQPKSPFGQSGNGNDPENPKASTKPKPKPKPNPNPKQKEPA